VVTNTDASVGGAGGYTRDDQRFKLRLVSGP
jgi:hypothetical protein